MPRDGSTSDRYGGFDRTPLPRGGCLGVIAALLLGGCANTIAIEQATHAAEINRRASVAAVTTEGRRIALSNYRAWAVQRYALTGEEPPAEVKAWLEK